MTGDGASADNSSSFLTFLLISTGNEAQFIMSSGCRILTKALAESTNRFRLNSTPNFKLFDENVFGMLFGKDNDGDNQMD